MDLPLESDPEPEVEDFVFFETLSFSAEDVEESESDEEEDEEEDFGGFVARAFLTFLVLQSKGSELELILEWLESSDDAIDGAYRRFSKKRIG
jgi:hypothetical protein